MGHLSRMERSMSLMRVLGTWQSELGFLPFLLFRPLLPSLDFGLALAHAHAWRMWDSHRTVLDSLAALAAASGHSLWLSYYRHHLHLLSSSPPSSHHHHLHLLRLLVSSHLISSHQSRSPRHRSRSRSRSRSHCCEITITIIITSRVGHCQIYRHQNRNQIMSES